VNDPVVTRYLRLGLQLGRHVEGIVDAYFGPPDLAAAVQAAPPVEPAALVADAEALRDELPDGWLRDQVTGLRTYAAGLAGAGLSYADEVEGCYGLRPTFTDEAVFAAAHERLDELLPGEGSLARRHERWRQAMLVPPEQIGRTVLAVIAEARAQTGALVQLPAGEGIDVATVRDVPWLGFNTYLGNLRGRVEVNVSLPMSAMDLLRVAIHESYPGHQAERAIKEQRLVRDEGRLEESIVLVPTPQSLVSEGIGRLAPQVLLERDGATAFTAILAQAGVGLDLGHALAVERAAEPCRWAEVNAALLRYQSGADEAETHAYLRRWALHSDELAAHLVRFINEPTSRTYVMNYPAGFALCEAYVAGQPARLCRLLTEQTRVCDLLEAGDAGGVATPARAAAGCPATPPSTPRGAPGGPRTAGPARPPRYRPADRSPGGTPG
jgi:hypothetical protein